MWDCAWQVPRAVDSRGCQAQVPEVWRRFLRAGLAQESSLRTAPAAADDHENKAIDDEEDGGAA